MKKYYIYILLFITIITIVIIVIKKEDTSFVVDGVKYSTSLNGAKTDSFPSKGDYEVSVNCTNATGVWDYSLWKMKINDITGKVSCNISFTSKTAENLNSHIISLAGTINDNGGVVNENGYRYEGKNPNNYIYFNNELWRIIGVFDSASHGVTNSNLTKIIRNESIGGLVWNKSNSNNWASSSLYNLLNNNYYNKTDGTSSGNCYQYSTSVGGNCDYSYIGLSSEYRNMVQSVTWYLGGKDSNSYTANDFYTSERDSSAIYGSNSGAVTNYIGLMYVSDYGYSPLSSSCARTTDLSSYNSSSCAGSSWLKKETYEWTITPRSSSSRAFYVSYSGYLINDIPSHGYALRPVLYLKSNVKKISGDGTISNPYKIGI